ncbi:MAG TPA: hypothetical protein VKI20_09630, partial [Acidimicrobiales bacterium]|nr:hypothetical protein [Acidimicrobiales bacterium]
TSGAPAGLLRDVQVGYCPSSPCSPTYQSWLTGVSSNKAIYSSSSPGWQGAGLYFFRARLRDGSTGAHSGWSPPAQITVSP